MERCKEYNFQYAIINNEDITLFNDSFIEYNMEKNGVLIDVIALIDKYGLLHLSGKELQHRCAINKTLISELKEQPLKKYIKHDCGNKWLGIKPFDYVQGWYITNEQNAVKYIFKNFRIKICE